MGATEISTKNLTSSFLSPYRLVIIVFIFMAFFLRVPLLQVRYFDSDEFQHLHSALQIYHGQIPYRDYFEHHTPFLHFIMSGFYSITGENINVLFAARGLMLVFTAAVLCLTFILARQLFGIDAGLFATLFLSFVSTFIEKTLETRPDLGAITFWLTSIIFMIKGIQNKASLKWHLLSGLSLGTALMFSQKTLFGLPGIFIALIYPFFDRNIGISFKHNIRLTLGWLIGIAIPIILTLVFFLIHGALWHFINCNFIINSHWPRRLGPMPFIKSMINDNPFLLLMGLAGLFVNIVAMHRREEIAKGIFIPVFCAISLSVGYFIIPVSYPQYSLLLIPLLAIYSGFIISKCIGLDFRQADAKPKKKFLLLLGIILGLVVTNMISLHIGKPGLANLNNIIRGLHLNQNVLYLVIIDIVIVSAIVTFIFNKREYAFILLSIATIIHPLDNIIGQFSIRNDGQLASINYIMANTNDSDAIFDAWSGYGFLRPHAYYYYFLHPQMTAMLTEKELTDDLIKSVEEHNTKIVVYDACMKALPKKTQDYLIANFVPTGQGDLYIRKELNNP